MGDPIKRIGMRMTKRFGKLTVLQDFALEIAGGEFVTLLGPSGCGKTTALNCLAGLIDLTAGEISIDDTRIDNVPTEKRGIGIVFQNYALFPHLSVFRNVAFGLEIQKRPTAEIEERVQAMLSLVRLAGYGSRYPAQLSGGQQQRVAIARALALQPRLMLFDEPLSNLDSKLRTDMRGEIKNLHRRLELTSVYVTHDQVEALSLSDKIVVLNNGLIQQIGTPKEVYEAPSNIFVADFMGFKNFFAAAIVERTGASCRARLKESGDLVTVKTAGAWRTGDEVTLAIRPEDVSLQPSASSSMVNSLAGQVRMVEYLGQDNSVEVEFPGGRSVTARTNRPVTLESAATVVLEPSKIIILPPES